MDKAGPAKLALNSFWQTLTILSLAAIVGLVSNQLRSDRLPLAGNWAAQDEAAALSGKPATISLDDAEVLFFTGSAVFLDARSPDLYELGHIQGAYNLPWEDFQSRFDQVMAGIPPQTTIITYCDGNGCSLSNELALVLLDKGYPDVKVLLNGWTLWQQNDLPVEFGDKDSP